MNIKFYHWLLITFFLSLLVFYLLSFVSKKTYLHSYLVVDQLNLDYQEKDEVQCPVILAWKLPKMTASLATSKIKAIFSSSREWELNLSHHPLFFINQEKIGISNFTNQCQWMILPVLVQLPTENLTSYLWKKLNPF